LKGTKKMTRVAQIRTPTAQMVLGTIEHLDADGVAWVTHPGVWEPVPARVVVSGPWVAPRLVARTTVLLLLQDDHGPVILGHIRELGQLCESASVQTTTTNAGQQNVLIEAHESLTLRCGASSLTMRKDGRVVLKGSRLLSRASQGNKIKGASVNIN